MDTLMTLAADPAVWAALITLIVMEVVLGIDNLIFISILSNKLPPEHRTKARRIGIGLALIMRLVRAEMLEVLRTDYIKFARARGLTNRAVHFGHALKNTLVPVMTISGLQNGGLIAFASITETVFQWPGMGLLFIQAVSFADIPVMAAYLCLIALIFVVINLIVDLLYFAVDPRLRVEKPGGH